MKGEENIRTEGKVNLMLEKGYELIEIETNEVIRNVLVDDEIDLQGLREKLERGELPLRVKGKAVLKDKNNNEKERTTIIAEKWIEKGYVNVTIGGIMRLLKLGYDELRLENDREFIDRYIEYNDLLDDELMIKLNELDDKTKTEKRLEQLKNLIKVLEIEVSDGELLRLISMEYKDVDILSADFIKLFQEYKNEADEEIKRILDEYLKKFEIEEESEEEVKEENDDTDKSEKTGEILSPEEHEVWDENTEGFNENEFENENENVINTEGFGLSQNSDSNSDIENSDTKSELSDYNLQDLFQENILLNMGATRDEVREDFRAALLAATGHDIGGNWAGLVQANPLANATVDEIRGLFRTFVQNQYGNDLGNDLGTANPNLVNNALGNINATRGLVVEFPLFGGSENEDAGEWVQRFGDAYTTNALADDNVNRFRIAKGCLVGTAKDWLRTEGVNIDNWGAGNNDTSLDRRVVSKYASDEIKERWQDELENIKQGDKESITGYVTRFRSMVKKAGGDAAVPVGSQKRIFMKGLSLEYIRGVYATKPANLNEAITAARNQETGMRAVAARFSGKEIVEEKNMEEILKEGTNKYKKMNPIAKELQNKEVKNDEIEELIKGFKRMEAHMLKINENNRRPMRNNNRNNVDWSKAICYTCGG
ncbi:unnamed protein product [Rhizophagus irregularis]|nr:unnamed protein product [Rhizophagus irregularis]